MKNLYLVTALAVFSLFASSCRSLAAVTTPDALQDIPMKQSLLLESAIESIEAGSSSWVAEDGNVLREQILGVLRADKDAWDELDRFYNPGVEE